MYSRQDNQGHILSPISNQNAISYQTNSISQNRREIYPNQHNQSPYQQLANSKIDELLYFEFQFNAQQNSHQIQPQNDAQRIQDQKRKRKNAEDFLIDALNYDDLQQYDSAYQAYENALLQCRSNNLKKQIINNRIITRMNQAEDFWNRNLQFISDQPNKLFDSLINKWLNFVNQSDSDIKKLDISSYNILTQQRKLYLSTGIRLKQKKQLQISEKFIGEAEKLFGSIIKNYPEKQQEILQLKIKVLEQLNCYELVLQYYNDLTVLNKSDKNRLPLIGICKVKLMQYQDAIDTFEEAFRLKLPLNDEEQFSFAQAYQLVYQGRRINLKNKRQIKQSQIYTSMGLINEEKHFLNQKNQWSIRQQVQNSNLAADSNYMQYFLQATKVDELQKSFQNCYYAAVSYIHLRDYDKALTLLQEAVNIDNKLEDKIYYQIAQFFVKKQEFNQALSYITKSINCGKQIDAYYLMRAHLYFQEKNYQDCINDYKNMKQIDLKKLSQVYFEFSKQLHHEKSLDNALLNSTEAIKNDTDNIEFIVWRGKLHYEMKKYNDAIADFLFVLQRKSQINDFNTIQKILAQSYYGLAKQQIEDPQSAIENLSNSLNYFMQEEIIFERGQLYYNLGKFDQAIGDFQKALDRDYRNKECLKFMGDILTKKNEYEKALECYSKAVNLSLNQNNLENQLLYKRGFIYFYLENYSKAEADLFNAIQNGNSEAQCFYMLGKSKLCQKHQLEETLEYYNIAEENGAQSIEFCLSKGELYALQGLEEEAKKYYSKASKSKAENPQEYYFRGKANQWLGQNAKAYDDYKIALESQIYIKDQVYFQRGQLYEKDSKFNNAIEDYSKAINLRSKIKSEYYLQRAKLNFKIGKIAQSNEDFIALQSQDQAKAAQGYFECGQICHEKQQFQQAIAYYEKAIQQNGNNKSYFFSRGNLFSELKYCDQAILDYTRAIELCSADDPDILYCRSLKYFEKKEFSKAKEDIEKAIILNNKSSNFYYLRGKIHLSLKQFGNAILDYSNILKINPEFDHKIFFDRGLSYYKTQDYENAIIDFQYLLQKQIQTKEILLYCAKSNFKLKKYPEAISYCNQIIATNYQNKQAFLIMANSQQNMSQYEQAIYYFDKVIEIEGSDQKALIQRAFCKLDLERFSDARKDLDLAANICSSNNNNNNNNKCLILRTRAIIKYNLNDIKGSIQDQIEANLSLDIDCAKIFYERGVRKMNEKNYKRAVEYLNQCIEIDENFSDAYLLLALSEKELNRFDFSLCHIKKAVKLHPQNEKYKEHLQNIINSYHNYILNQQSISIELQYNRYPQQQNIPSLLDNSRIDQNITEIKILTQVEFEHIYGTFEQIIHERNMIDKGGICKVYNGFNKQKRQYEAIKHAFSYQEQEYNSNFSEIIRIGNLKSHKNLMICRSICHRQIQIGQQQQQNDKKYEIFMIMAKAECSLDGMIRQIKQNNPQQQNMDLHLFKKLATDLTQGLMYMHLNKIYHFDLKPANILYLPHIFLIADFGASKIISTNNPNYSIVSQRTPRFQSPEIEKKFEQNEAPSEDFQPEKSDIWSLGAVLYCAYSLQATKNFSRSQIQSFISSNSQNEQVKELIKGMTQECQYDRFAWPQIKSAIDQI